MLFVYIFAAVFFINITTSIFFGLVKGYFSLSNAAEDFGRRTGQAAANAVIRFFKMLFGKEDKKNSRRY